MQGQDAQMLSTVNSTGLVGGGDAYNTLSVVQCDALLGGRGAFGRLGGLDFLGRLDGLRRLGGLGRLGWLGRLRRLGFLGRLGFRRRGTKVDRHEPSERVWLRWGGDWMGTRWLGVRF